MIEVVFKISERYKHKLIDILEIFSIGHQRLSLLFNYLLEVNILVLFNGVGMHEDTIDSAVEEPTDDLLLDGFEGLLSHLQVRWD